ncbi:hypothetical protein C1752_03962 [Acaryochloris thomasi RCC1774]|uniref:DUF1400 domain-containing protein n=1 Tax=Acaryochloris thomasi RCC1774 TaxID=1764569 RepID=A0A2W1JPM1_9CYAN|nr:alpha/beta hydrolase [Acaryochloris thomasi]PZD72104.1 hypothetical protein C1752_03962 [Acaryochloris thomasi RCC1774]
MSFLRSNIVRLWGLSAAAALAISAVTMPRPAAAAEKVVLTFGSFGRTLTLNELETFVETGKTSPNLKFLLRASGQDPEQARKFMTQEAKVSLTLADNLLHKIPGEYILFQTGEVLHTPTRRSNIQALRSSILLSLSDDGEISFLEFLQRYPTNDLVVDGFQLAQTAGRVNRFISSAEEDLKVPLAIATDLIETFVCDCNPGASAPSRSQPTPQ